MGRLFKFVAIAAGGLLALVIVAAILVSLFFDPNDFRDRISASVRESTGRELTIEGDIALKLFPWFAVEVGQTRLGNAEGFGDEPFASFDGARLSVRLMPLLLSREISVGTAELQSLQVNLAVDAAGRGNWEDLLEEAAEAPQDDSSQAAGGSVALDISGIDVSNTRLVYENAQTGERIEVRDVNMRSGRVAAGEPIPFEGGLGFAMTPAGISGQVELETTAMFDTDTGAINMSNLQIAGDFEGVASAPVTLAVVAPDISVNTKEQSAAPGTVDIDLLGVKLRATVQPFSYAGGVEPKATIQVDEFSPRELAQKLDIEIPATADPGALGRMSLDAGVDVGENAIAMSDLILVLDDTRLTGNMSVPRDSGGAFVIDLSADNFDLNRYMAPPGEGAATTETEAVAVEIPADLLRPLRARGSLDVAEILMGAIPLQNVEVRLAAADGKTRINPISATVFDGAYNGDVQIDVSGETPLLSMNERIEGVGLAPLAKAVFGTENVTGAINGNFQLTGRGSDTAELQRTLNGTMAFELLDGAWEGTDVWHELRSARALFKGQPAPEPRLPARTEFSSVKATGKVTDGIFRNDDLQAELPFMRVTGGGTVDLPQATVNYSLTARVLDKPEFVTDATDEELEEFTEAVIPLKISGPLADPSIKPDVEKMLRDEVEKKVKDELLDRLFGGDEQAEGEAAPAEGEEAPADEPKKPEDELKDALKDLLKR